MRTHALCTLPTDPKVDPAVAAAQLAVMHGRVKKDVVEPTPEEKAKQREQVRTARSLFAKLLALRQSQTYGAEALEMTSKALQFHPEFPTLWGYRRELLTTSEKPLQELLKMEMKLLEKALRKSQKVYSIWFHRKWVVERLFKELEKEEEAIRNLLNNELDLCNQLLAVDERNFHCWNHRMYLMDLMRTWGKDKSNPIDLNAIDLKLSTDLINQNFSNYSAWHLRTLLQQPRGEEPEMKLDVEEELEWVQQGIYTEPNDQSVWLYHQWLTLEGSQVIEITHCAVMDGELFIFFSRPVCASSASVGIATGSLEAILPKNALKRTRDCGKRRSWAVGWRFIPEVQVNFSNDVKVTVTLHNCGTGSVQSCVFNGRPLHLDSEMASIEVKSQVSQSEILKAELLRIDELLEIEPDCRWALLARMRLQLASSPRIDEATLIANLERMSALDPLRRNFYADSKANALLQHRLMEWNVHRSSELKLVGLGLKHIAPTMAAIAFGVRILRLEENELQEFGPLLGLLSLNELYVSRNQIRGDVAEVFALKRLKKVDLSCNRLSIGKQAELFHAPDVPEKLQEVDLSGNTHVLGSSEKISQLFPSWKLQFGEGGKCLAQKPWRTEDLASKKNKCAM